MKKIIILILITSFFLFEAVRASTSWTESCANTYGTCAGAGTFCTLGSDCYNADCASATCPSRTHASVTNNCGSPSYSYGCVCSANDCGGGTATCTFSGSCDYTCDSDWFNDDGDNSNGCENQRPKWSQNSTNTTTYTAGTPIEFRVNWTDTTNSLSGYIFSFDNCTGSFSNDTWVDMSKIHTPDDYRNYTGGGDAFSLDPTKAWDDGYNDTTTWAIMNSTGSGTTNIAYLEINFTDVSAGDEFYYTWNVTFLAWTGWFTFDVYNFTSGSWGLIDRKTGNTSWTTSSTTLTSDQVSNGLVMARFWTSGTASVTKVFGKVGDIYIDTSPTTAWSNVTKVINSTSGCTIKWKVYANDTYDRWNTTDIFSFVTIPKYGWMNVTLSTPSPSTCTDSSPCKWLQNNTYWINATVECRDGECGNVNGTVRYNDTGDVMTEINTTTGATPFHIVEALSKPISWREVNDTGSYSNPTYAYDDDFNDTSTYAEIKTYCPGSGCSQTESIEYTWDLIEANATLFYTWFTTATGDIAGNVIKFWNWGTNQWDSMIDAVGDQSTAVRTLSINSTYVNSTGGFKVLFYTYSTYALGLASSSIELYDIHVSTPANTISCGSLLEEQQCNLTWRVNTTGNLDTYWKIDINSTSSYSQVSPNDTDDAIIKISWPRLIVTLLTPTPSIQTNWIQNQTYSINATVECRDGPCGNVNGTARYNASSSDPDTPINTTKGDKPFYNVSGENPQSCGSLNDEDTCQLNWTVNVTGNANTYREIDVNFTSDNTSLSPKDTNNAIIKIILPPNVNVQGIALYYYTGERVNGNVTVIPVEDNTNKGTSTVTNGEWSVDFYMDTDNVQYLTVIIDDAQKIGYNELKLDNDVTASLTCSGQDITVSGYSVDLNSGSSITSGNVRVSVLDTDYTNTTSFTGTWSIDFHPCLIPGRIYTLQILISDNTGKRGEILQKYSAR